MRCRSAIPEVRLLAERRLRGLPASAASAVVAWADGERPAELWLTIPTPREVLALSARGRRCVSLLARADGLGFAIHDLCHLEKFVEPAHFLGQVGFFAALERALEHTDWAHLCTGFDHQFACDLEHVMADMNASPIFLFCGLRSRVASACARLGIVEAPRFALLCQLLQLHGSVGELALIVRSRHAPRSAAVGLAGYFADLGRGALAQALPSV
jgi:hypothetical protein